MRHYFTILGHEVRILLVNPSTYVAAVLFLTVMGVVFAGILDGFSKEAQESSPVIDFFRTFFIPVLFMVPLLTMRCLAEERRLGTIETLLTTPVTTTEVVLGKYSAAYLLYSGMWLSTGGFFYVLYRFSGDARLIDLGALIGGYVFVTVSGLLFISIGLFASSLSRNQAVAGTLAFTMLFLLFVGLMYLPQLSFIQTEELRSVREMLESAQMFDHLNDFCRGIIDTRQIIFYLSGTALMLLFSILGVEAKLIHT